MYIISTQFLYIHANLLYMQIISESQQKGLDSLVTSRENNYPAGVHGQKRDSLYGFSYLLNFDPGECVAYAKTYINK